MKFLSAQKEIHSHRQGLSVMAPMLAMDRGQKAFLQLPKPPGAFVVTLILGVHDCSKGCIQHDILCMLRMVDSRHT